jgi:hypothetical protein
MTEHLSKPRLERLSARALSPRELALSTQHLANCQPCRRQYQAIREVQRGGSTVKFTLAPEEWLRHEHLDYDQLVALADQSMVAEDGELIDLHLKICASCREDVRSFLAFREQIGPELLISYARVRMPASKRDGWFAWWRGLGWQFRYAAVFVLIVVAAGVYLVLFKRKADTLEARQSAPTEVRPSVSNQLPSPNPTAQSSALVQPPPGNDQPASDRSTAVANRKSPVITITDSHGVVIYKEGSVSGLDDVSSPTRRDVVAALRSESIPRPAVLDQVEERSSALRGRRSRESFNLISPARAVIAEDRPLCKWERFVDAHSYRVYVTDSHGKVVAKSEELRAASTQWKVSEPLRRGEIYSWAVVAQVEGKEIVSPGSGTSEVRFQILSTEHAQDLARLKQTGSHLAIGVFCARVGLLGEAQVEFEELLRLNPQSRLIRRLLESLKRRR